MRAPDFGWPEPAPLEAFDLPPFPVGVFPTRWNLRDWPRQTPRDLPGMLALAVLATCAQNGRAYWCATSGRSPSACGWLSCSARVIGRLPYRSDS